MADRFKVGLMMVAGVLLAGCASFKPVVQNTRYFVLTPEASATNSPVYHVGRPIGLGPVVVPGYLLQNQFAIRRGGNEIHYFDNFRWAERLDKNIQRVLAEDLGRLLGSQNVYPASWRRAEVGAEIYVSFDRFELNEDGTATLEASWAVTTPGSETTQRHRVLRITRPGAPISNHPHQAIAALSSALAELSREIAAALSSEPKK